jgi:replicative DNA helicase
MNAIVSQQTKIPAEKFRNNNLNPEETELIFQKIQEYENIPLYVYDYPFLTVSDIEEILECNPPDFTEIIIIDSLQLMAKNKKDQATKVLNKRELTKITFKLKKLAVKFNITILLIADINLISKKYYMRPLLSDIRKYAPIETYADLVLLLYRPEYYKIEEWDDEYNTPTNGEGEIIIAKNKNGILDNIRVKFDGHLGMFDNLSS